MKSVIVLIALVGMSAWACNTKTFDGPIHTARLIEGKTLECHHNGARSQGVVTVAMPRCMGAHPVVELEAFEQILTIQKLSVRRGAKTYQYLFTTAKSNLPIICVVPKMQN